MTTLLTQGAAITLYTYVERPPPLYNSYVQGSTSVDPRSRRQRPMNKKGT